MIISNLKSNVRAGLSPTRVLYHRALYHRGLHTLVPMMCIMLVLFLAGCGGTGDTTVNTSATTATPAHERVNGFGTALNHPHSLMALSNNVLLLATHYGLFRSADGGRSWTEVAGGPNQIMEDLMTYSLTKSPLNPQRLYVLTQPVTSDHKGILGLYSSSDQGKSWQLAITTASLSQNDIYLTAAGNRDPQEVYIYLMAGGADGLKVSKDGGKHFSPTGKLPFGSLAALLPIPGAPGELLAGNSDGLVRSVDGGVHWTIIKDIDGGIFSLSTSGPKGPIYASGDSGVYVSHDGGKTFSLIYSKSSFSSIAIAPTQPKTLYAKTGTIIYHSADGGRSWNTLPHINGNLYSLQADPTDPGRVYLSLSYPTAVYRYDQAGNKWTSLTPK
jgi:BNR/Asp-box repeat